MRELPHRDVLITTVVNAVQPAGHKLIITVPNVKADIILIFGITAVQNVRTIVTLNR